MGSNRPASWGWVGGGAMWSEMAHWQVGSWGWEGISKTDSSRNGEGIWRFLRFGVKVPWACVGWRCGPGCVSEGGRVSLG